MIGESFRHLDQPGGPQGVPASLTIAASFDALMGPAGHDPPDPEVLITDGWESVRTVVEVGGGTGSLQAAILRARPTVRGRWSIYRRPFAQAGERGWPTASLWQAKASLIPRQPWPISIC